MHEMKTIAIDDLGVCQSVTRTECVKTAERIDVRFRVEAWNPRNSALDGDPHSPWRWEGGSMRPLPNYFGHLLRLLVARSGKVETVW